MALAFFVDSPDGLAKAFAAHDEYLAIFTYFTRGRDSSKDYKPLSPDVDEGYTSPYCFMPKHYYNQDHYSNHQQYSHQNQHRAKGEQSKHAGYLIFVAQVPWVESYFPNINYNINREEPDLRSPHHDTLEWMKRNSKSTAPILGSVEDFQEKLELRDEEVFTFTKDGCYPTEWEVSQALEERAVEVTCDAMGWEFPKYWRGLRQELVDLHGISILDLAVWDKSYHQRLQKRRRRSLGNGRSNDNVDGAGKNIEELYSASTIADTAAATTADQTDKCCYDRQEEKKDCSTEEHQC